MVLNKKSNATCYGYEHYKPTFLLSHCGQPEIFMLDSVTCKNLWTNVEPFDNLDQVPMLSKLMCKVFIIIFLKQAN